MYCKKCGFELSENIKKCPFCGEEINKKAENKQAPKYNDYVPYYKNNGEKPINSLDYLNISTKWWHHLIIACGGYITMYILIMIVGKICVSISQSNGADFSCIVDSTKTCSEGAEKLYYLISMCSQIFAELAIVGAVIVIFRKYLKSFLKELKQGRTYKWFGIMIGIMFVSTLTYSLILNILKVEQTSANQEAVVSVVKSNPLLGFAFVVLAAPLFEEIIFRFGIFRTFTHRNGKYEIVGIVVTTLAFASIHMVATLEEVAAEKDISLLLLDLPTFPTYLIGAFCLTFAYYKSKNFITPIMMHMVWNFYSFLSILLVNEVTGTTSEIVNFIVKLLN